MADGVHRTKLAWADISKVRLDAGESKLRIALTSGGERAFEVRFITVGENEVVTEALRGALGTYLHADQIESERADNGLLPHDHCRSSLRTGLPSR